MATKKPKKTSKGLKKVKKLEATKPPVLSFGWGKK